MSTGTALTTPDDVTTPATKQDLRRGLALLSSLPSQAAASAEIQLEATWIAVEGVTRHALVSAVKSILRGQIGRGFFPSPAELRKACDAAQAVVDQSTENERLKAEIAANRDALERRERELAETREQRVQARLDQLRERQANYAGHEAAMSALAARRGIASEIVERARQAIAGGEGK